MDSAQANSPGHDGLAYVNEAPADTIDLDLEQILELDFGPNDAINNEAPPLVGPVVSPELSALVAQGPNLTEGNWTPGTHYCVGLGEDFLDKLLVAWIQIDLGFSICQITHMSGRRGPDGTPIWPRLWVGTEHRVDWVKPDLMIQS